MSEIRLDRLLEKHEYFPYDEEETKTMTVTVAGSPVKVLVPDDFPDVEPLVVTDNGDLLFILGEIHAPPSWNLTGCGAMIVAKRQAPGVYAAQVWHELYSYALADLGLRPRASGASGG